MSNMKAEVKQECVEPEEPVKESNNVRFKRKKRKPLRQRLSSESNSDSEEEVDLL